MHNSLSYCKDCKRNTESYSRSLNRGLNLLPMWFENHKDRNRAGAAPDPLLTQGNLSVVVVVLILRRYVRKEISRAVEVIKKHVEVDTGTLHASELLRRFCSNLGMKNQAMKAVQQADENSEEIDIRGNPKSISAVIGT
ncbi:hypothetical protein GH714_012629 [Hevea brasiliensis]|uniref:Uncharacterized protein n=1 Tax=Hevea brasiliensis TaxID=3981 RepID=A0A6A6MIU3_HEVBR|nr:hypothetical protein GH714_012629 [Hevea brasiliensis]